MSDLDTGIRRSRAGRLSSILVGAGIPLLSLIFFTLAALLLPPTILPPLAWACLHLLIGGLLVCCPLLAVWTNQQGRAGGASLRDAWRAIGGKRIALLDIMIVVLLGVLVTIPLQVLYYAGLHALFGVSDDFGFSQSSQALLPFVLIVVVVGPLGEEVFFRGYLGTFSWKPWQYIALSSIIWSVLHVDPVALPPLLWTGIVLAVMRLRTGSWYASYLVHVMINVLALALFLWAR